SSLSRSLLRPRCVAAGVTSGSPARGEGMVIRALVAVAGAVIIAALTVWASVGVRRAEAIPAFARQYDMQCNACHTRPPRLNRFGEQFHMMGFQIPSASRPDGLEGSLREDGPGKTLIDSLAL